MNALMELKRQLDEYREALRNADITMDYFDGYNKAVALVDLFIDDEQKQFEEYYYMKRNLSDL